MDKLRFDSLQGLRGIAALAVVLFHLRIVEFKYLQGTAFLDDIARYGSAGVDLFFVLSGFLMTTITAGRYIGPAAAGEFLGKRAWRVLPLYWIFTTLVVVLMAIVPSMVNSSYANQSVLASYLLIPDRQMPILSVGWTLVYEAYFYLVFALAIALVAERFVPLYLFAWGTAIAVGSAMLQADSPYALSVATSSMTYEFIAGAFLGLYWHRIPAKLAWPLVMSGVLLAIGAAALLPAGGPTTIDLWTQIGCFGGAGLLLIAGTVMLEAQGRLHLPTWLLRLGDSSYSLYLSHVFAISALGRVWGRVFTSPSWVNHLVFVVFATIATCVAGYLVHRWLERPLLALQYRKPWSARQKVA